MGTRMQGCFGDQQPPNNGSNGLQRCGHREAQTALQGNEIWRLDNSGWAPEAFLSSCQRLGVGEAPA